MCNATDALEKLKQGNKAYLTSVTNPGNIGAGLRVDLAKNGQHPFAVIITCSDSRVAPEHLFSCGIGEIFVIRTAGNVAAEFELGSIEYGAEHLGAKLIVVLGHSGCGAVAAAMGGHAGGHLASIIDEIGSCIQGADDTCDAENRNIKNTRDKILADELIASMASKGEVEVVCAKYDIVTGEVKFF